MLRIGGICTDICNRALYLAFSYEEFYSIKTYHIQRCFHRRAASLVARDILRACAIIARDDVTRKNCAHRVVVMTKTLVLFDYMLAKTNFNECVPTLRLRCAIQAKCHAFFSAVRFRFSAALSIIL